MRLTNKRILLEPRKRYHILQNLRAEEFLPGDRFVMYGYTYEVQSKPWLVGRRTMRVQIARIGMSSKILRRAKENRIRQLIFTANRYTEIKPWKERTPEDYQKYPYNYMVNYLQWEFRRTGVFTWGWYRDTVIRRRIYRPMNQRKLQLSYNPADDEGRTIKHVINESVHLEQV